jgi:hypothetical protein
MRLLFLAVPFLLLIASCQPNNSDLMYQQVKQELSSDFFETLYSNTYYNLLDRIEPDGFLQESQTGQYDGMYARTVGAMVPLLIETGELTHAERLVNCVFDAMTANGMTRVPHVLDRKRYLDKPADSVNNPYRIIGRTDQIDGQAHIILAWAKLALYRGETNFENRTWRIAAALMEASVSRPYFGREESGAIPDLIYNYAFEHSRLVPSNYNLLTQCFVGSALESMIAVAKRRGENDAATRWQKKLDILRAGIQKHFVQNVDGKDVYYELLLNENNTHIPFYGMGWVNLSPVAAQWEPLSHDILVNTVTALRKSIQTWNDIKWMPTDSWPNGEFYGQMIGKGIAWEMEYAAREKEWARLYEICSMLRVVQHRHPLYMENAYLANGTKQDIYTLSKADLTNLQQGVWRIVDAGNGEQVAWWCLAMARIRKQLQLPVVGPKRSTPSIADSSRTLNKSIHGLLYSYFRGDKNSNSFGWLSDEPLVVVPQNQMHVPETVSADTFGLIWKGYIATQVDDDYRFFCYTANSMRVLIDNEIVEQGRAVFLEKGYHPITFQYDHVAPDESIEVYVQQGDKPFREILQPDRLFYTLPEENRSAPPIIEPAVPEIESGEFITVSLQSFDSTARVYYTLHGEEPTEKSTLFTKPFEIHRSTLVRAVAVQEGFTKSEPTQVRYQAIPKKMLVKLQHPPHANYTARGLKTLTDKLTGSRNGRDGRWLGFEGTDFNAVLDLRGMKTIQSIKLNFLHDQAAWIFAPRNVYISVSNDGQNYVPILHEDFDTITKADKSSIKTYNAVGKGTPARFVRIAAQNAGAIPGWHPGAGGKAWIFVDEIEIETN